MSETDNPVAATIAPPGAALAAARTAQNLGVADAARHLKLSVSQIEALEAGAFDKLPGPVFVRGFIRNYARLLKLDPEALLRSIEPNLPPPAGGEAAPPSKDIPFPSAKTRRWPWYAAAMLLLIGGLAVYEFYGYEPDFTVIKPVSAPEETVANPAPVQSITSAPAATATAMTKPVSAENAPAVSVSDAGPSAVVQVAQLNKAAPESAPAAQAAAAEAENAPKPGERPLQFVFQEDSWVEIRDRSGKIIFSQLNQAGSKRRVYGKPPLSMIVGNAHGVRLTYNDKPVDLERHTKVDVARFTLE